MKNKIINLIAAKALKSSHKNKWGRIFVLAYLLTKSYKSTKPTENNKQK